MLRLAQRQGRPVAAALRRKYALQTFTRALASNWMPKDKEELSRMAREALIHQLTEHQQRVSEELVPWYLKTMPASYFRQTTEHSRLEHLRAIGSLYGTKAGASSDVRLTLNTELPDGAREVTVIRPGTQHHSSEILKLLSSMPDSADASLTRVKLFESQDKKFTLYVFQYDQDGSRSARRATLDDAAHLLDYARKVQAGEEDALEASESFSEEAMAEYVLRSTKHYVNHSSPRRFLRQKHLYDKVVDGEGCAGAISAYRGDHAEAGGYSAENRFWIDVALSNVIPMVVLRGAMRLLSQLDVDLVRVHVDVVAADSTSDVAHGEEEQHGVTMLRLLVKDEGGKLQDEARAAEALRHLERMKWYDERTLSLGIDQRPELGLDRAEICVALASMLHGPLNKHNPWAFMRSSLFDMLSRERHAPLLRDIADLFLDKFRPGGAAPPPEELAARAAAIREEIARGVGASDDAAGLLLNSMVDAVEATLRCNVHRADRYALSLRVDADIMAGPQPFSEEEGRPKPYGVYFVHGRRFNGFHVRFRDISRGGMRLVTPAGAESHSFESSRQFDEAYGLAFAQQLKNKDIPEGGSKAVCLIDTHHGVAAPLQGEARHHALRKSAKAMTDGLLDLIVAPAEGEEPLVDYLGRPEILYLGPDEQVIPDDIVWITQQAKKRGYWCPDAFMSSKPGAGINHKDYGVTSEGVNVFLAEALRYQGIEPTKEPFTVALTGGPDGDVAGNMLRIMHRDYGDNVRVVGLADGSGCAEDPAGLDMKELLRLFEEQLPIGEYKGPLGPEGRLLTADTEEGVRARNTLHFRAKANAFVPAGGRPGTVNSSNWQEFLDADGVPCAPVVVEGANLFFTPEARQQLFEAAGVKIVKDSSANKAGVICSSFEICSSMLLSNEEFMDKKQEIVADVVRRLQAIAKQEAQLLFREYHNYKGALPHFSMRISDAINTLTDAIRGALDTDSPEDFDNKFTVAGAEGAAMPAEEELLPLFRDHLPASLSDMAFDRVLERVPEPYRLNAYASSLASQIVYNEGIHFVEVQPRERLANMAIAYMRKERELAAALEGFDSAPEEQRAAILDMARRGGVRREMGL